MRINLFNRSQITYITPRTGFLHLSGFSVSYKIFSRVQVSSGVHRAFLLHEMIFCPPDAPDSD